MLLENDGVVGREGRNDFDVLAEMVGVEEFGVEGRVREALERDDEGFGLRSPAQGDVTGEF